MEKVSFTPSGFEGLSGKGIKLFYFGLFGKGMKHLGSEGYEDSSKLRIA